MRAYKYMVTNMLVVCSVKRGVCSIEPVSTLGVYTCYIYNEAFNPVVPRVRAEIYARMFPEINCSTYIRHPVGKEISFFAPGIYTLPYYKVRSFSHRNLLRASQTNSIPRMKEKTPFSTR